MYFAIAIQIDKYVLANLLDSGIAKMDRVGEGESFEFVKRTVGRKNYFCVQDKSTLCQEY